MNSLKALTVQYIFISQINPMISTFYHVFRHCSDCTPNYLLLNLCTFRFKKAFLSWILIYLYLFPLYFWDHRQGLKKVAFVIGLKTMYLQNEITKNAWFFSNYVHLNLYQYVNYKGIVLYWFTRSSLIYFWKYIPTYVINYQQIIIHLSDLTHSNLI